MLVSSIAQFDAINTKNNAAYASMQAMNTASGLVSNMHAFGGDIGMLHEMDNALSIQLLTNSLMYRLACLQEKMFSKMHNDKVDNYAKSINYVA